jgi:transposase-like protein
MPAGQYLTCPACKHDFQTLSGTYSEDVEYSCPHCAATLSLLIYRTPSGVHYACLSTVN